MLWQEHPCRTWAAMNKASNELRPQHPERERRGRAAAASTPLGGGSLGQMLELPPHTPTTFMDLATCPEGQPVYPDIVQRGTRGDWPSPLQTRLDPALCKRPTLAGLGPGCGGNLSPRSKPCRAVNLGARRRGKQRNPALNVRVLKCTALLKDCVQSLGFFSFFLFFF